MECSRKISLLTKVFTKFRFTDFILPTDRFINRSYSVMSDIVISEKDDLAIQIKKQAEYVRSLKNKKVEEQIVRIN